MAEQAINNVINMMHGNQDTIVEQTKTEQGTSVVLEHTDVFTNDGFVDMNKTQFVWARAFLNCYIPSYTCKNGQIQWVITSNITGFNGLRERNMKFNDWLHHQIWRSDGLPAKHPTWSICMLNHRMKTALQK